MQNILKWFTGLTFAVIQLEAAMVTYCNCAVKDDVHGGCCCFNYVKFPAYWDNLIPFLETLTMTILTDSSRTIKFDDDHFNRFNLTKLEIFADGIHNLEIPPGILWPLTYLEELNLSLLQVKPPEIPSWVKILKANEIGNESHPDMTQLDNLETLSFASNFLESFPKVSENAFLYEVNLSGNSLRSLTYEDIAPYCLMRVLIVNGSSIELDADKCCGLKMWANENNISSDIYCGAEDANCSSRVTEYNAKAKNLYSNCLGRTESYASPTMEEYFFQIIVSLALFLAVAFLAFKYYRYDSVKKYRKSKKAQKKRTYDEENEEN